jgi:hypothetical protein
MLRAGGWRAAALAAVVLTFFVAFVAACGGDDDDQSAPVTDLESGDSTSSPAADEGSSDSTEPQAPEDAAVDAYNASSDYMEQAVAANPPNPEDPALADYFSGSALSDNRTLLVQLREAGEYYQTSFDGNPDVASATADEVILTDCVSESTTSFDAATGEQKDTGSHVFNWRITVVNTDDGWRVNEILPQEQSCTP